ncbi:hypothetical protein V496_08258 [Pseudogymnoascus sp. VKM F-4515 (FW-2607)]|nr:hypothetical protein V496_08258 [Pseudogymnoascus sp. VKM F-4515 (FW-2607)]KFY78133.1 hypothetical protein V498_09187 [Pseudogymnoascus sp. VKM F-4517 (FW-2822)]
MFLKTPIILLSSAIGVWGHARIDSPQPRLTGNAHRSACGSAVVTKLESDKTGPIENSVSFIDDDYNCDMFLCRGYQFEDNTSNAMKLHAGDVIPFHINLVAGHRPGYANSSIVDTSTNEVVVALKTWDHWPDVTDGSTYDQKTNFNVTIPSGLESTCGTAGKHMRVVTTSALYLNYEGNIN